MVSRKEHKYSETWSRGVLFLRGKKSRLAICLLFIEVPGRLAICLLFIKVPAGLGV